MTLSAGTKLGAYEVAGAIGALPASLPMSGQAGPFVPQGKQAGGMYPC